MTWCAYQCTPIFCLFWGIYACTPTFLGCMSMHTCFLVCIMALHQYYWCTHLCTPKSWCTWSKSLVCLEADPKKIANLRHTHLHLHLQWSKKQVPRYLWQGPAGVEPGQTPHWGEYTLPSMAGTDGSSWGAQNPLDDWSVPVIERSRPSSQWPVQTGHHEEHVLPLMAGLNR
jgi:hypothetical protein